MTGLADTGRVIAGRYRLAAPIGRGAMGIVWRARDELLDRDVAVKEVQIAETLTEDERANAYQRTLREAKTAARLSHPAVVSVFDVANDDGRPWIVMELVNAQSLDQVLASSGPLPARSVAEIGRQLLSALSVAHAAGVLHRDVKPSNVLLSGDGRAVLTDFGIATFQGDPKLTATGMVMGSPGFTAPERIRGADASPASDLWSLGATLYAAVEGRGPYEARGGAFTTMSAIINEDAPAAPSAGALGPVIASLLRRDPAGRPDAVTASRMIGDVLPMLPGLAGFADRGGYQPTALAAQPGGGMAAAQPGGVAEQPGGLVSTEVSSGAAPPTMRQPGSEPAPPDFSSWYSSARSGERGDSGWSAYTPAPVRSSPSFPSAPSSSPAPSSSARSGGSGGHRPGQPRRGGLRWAIMLLVLALLGAAAGVIAVIMVRHQHTTGSPGNSGSSPPSSSSSSSTGGGGGSTTAAVDPLVSAINNPSSGPFPAGFTGYRRTAADAGTTAGFSIQYPSAWTQSVQGYSTFLRRSASAYTQVDLTQHQYPNDMLQEANYIKGASMGHHPGYAEIGLGRVTIRGAPGAYWKFTWMDNGVEREVLDLLWVGNTPAGPQSYAMLFTAPAANWNEVLPTFAAQAQSFATV